jgi:hypothetical protein
MLVMKIEIEVADEAQGEAIKRALSDPVTKSAVIVIGVLLPFSDRERERVLAFVHHQLQD